MLLSVCILMKDEVDCLRRLAAMVRGLADEVVVVCDEPVDGSFQTVASQCAVRLVPHRWQNNFAAKRNAGLEAARGEWIFWIDSDETLIAPDPQELRQLLERADILGYYVSIEDQTGGATMSSHQHPRIYRRREELRYVGRIHEHFATQLEVVARGCNMKALASPVRLTHTGYHLDKRSQKQQRNIALLEMELADRPGQLYYMIELGRMLLLSGQARGHGVLDEAARILLPRLNDSRPPLPSVAAFLEYALNHAAADFPISRQATMEVALRWFPSNPPLLWLVARKNYENGNIVQAAHLLERVLIMGETKRYDDSLSFDQDIFGDETRLNFGVCCAKMGQIKRAVEQFNLIRADSRFHLLAQQNLKKLRILNC